MPAPLAARAVVIGAGLGGLTAAKAIAPHFASVMVLDRDALPDEPAPRPGAPQGRHLHGLLPGGLNALETLFPGFRLDLESAGATRVGCVQDFRIERPGYDPFPQRDFGYDIFSLSRPLLERLCRRRLEEEPNVEVLPRRRVVDLTPAASGPPAVCGVVCREADGRTRSIASDLVIDASGRGSPTMAFLAGTGLPKPAETEIPANIAYATAQFELWDPPSDWRMLLHVARVPLTTRSAFMQPIENGRWIASLGGAQEDAPPGDIDGFMAFAKSLRTPTFYEAIKDAKLVGGIDRYQFDCSLRRDFAQGFPRGLVPVADSVCRFNPVFGQGMSVAAMEAVALGRLLGERRGLPDPLDGLPDAFLSEIRELIDAAWASVASGFAAMKDGSPPADFAAKMQYAAALVRLMAEDAEVHKLVSAVNSLLKPYSLLSDPELVSRVKALMPAPAALPA
jgi:2-polyprenyl-6-methoxyphenol hydroxylase-like FAD-dependent oxidoreductase